MTKSLVVAFLASLLFGVSAFQIPSPRNVRQSTTHLNSFIMEEKEVTKTESEGPPVDDVAEETTKKFGLEAGLFQSVKSGNTESAKSLLKKYGIAYLATSIPLALISFAICYVLVDNGVDVSSLLAKVGIDNSSQMSETAGTLAIAYAAHKAASPIRFPPTVLLTPVVAKLLGKEAVVDDEESR